MSGFYIQSSASASTTSALSQNLQSYDHHASVSDDEEYDLPFPTPLPRAAFLDPEFTPSNLLSTLTPRTRHQTLEDLRTELRNRSSILSRELLDLVNLHYADFVALGSALKGGDEKVEEVRVNLLALRREVERMQSHIGDRKREISNLLAQREAGRRELETGRELFRWLERLELLEERLRIPAGSENRESGAVVYSKVEDQSYEIDDVRDIDDVETDDDDGDDSVDPSIPILPLSRLCRRIDEYQVLLKQAKRLGLDHPFVQNMGPRLDRLRDTILLDLNATFMDARTKADKDKNHLIKILSLYRNLGCESSALEVLRGSNGK